MTGCHGSRRGRVGVHGGGRLVARRDGDERRGFGLDAPVLCGFGGHCWGQDAGPGDSGVLLLLSHGSNHVAPRQDRLGRREARPVSPWEGLRGGHAEWLAHDAGP